jgi:hypothetical protein
MIAHDLRRLYRAAQEVASGDGEPQDYLDVERYVLNNIIQPVTRDTHELGLSYLNAQGKRGGLGDIDMTNVMQAYMLAVDIYFQCHRRRTFLNKYKADFWAKYERSIRRYGNTDKYPTVDSSHPAVYEVPVNGALMYTFEFGDMMHLLYFENPYHAVYVVTHVESEFTKWMQDKLHTLD